MFLLCGVYLVVVTKDLPGLSVESVGSDLPLFDVVPTAVIAECSNRLGLIEEVYLDVLFENEIPVVTDSSESGLPKQLLLVNAECRHGLSSLVVCVM